MNWRAKLFGCKNTHFNNPNGLPDENHYTTASDMAKIAKSAWLNPLEEIGVKLRDGMIRRNYQNEQKIPAADLEW